MPFAASSPQLGCLGGPRPGSIPPTGGERKEATRHITHAAAGFDLAPCGGRADVAIATEDHSTQVDILDGPL